MMERERSYHTFDTTLCVNSLGRKVNEREYRPDWHAYNRLKVILRGQGFAIAVDPDILKNYKIIAKFHHLGCRWTPHGDLWVSCETYPAGCKFTFFQNVVTVNRHGGRYDFDRRQKMPYLIGKAFERAVTAMRADLDLRGFVDHSKPQNPAADPLAYFNSVWDGEYERRRGLHRFKRDESGWPAESELRSWPRKDRNGQVVNHGCIRYFRGHDGYIRRGRCYGGINGMWMVVYGPNPCSVAHLHVRELFTCDPRTLPRRVHPNPTRRLNDLLHKSVDGQDFERAIRFRDALARLNLTAAAA